MIESEQMLHRRARKGSGRTVAAFTADRYRRNTFTRYNNFRMATINRQDILAALMRLGELAAAREEQLDLLLLGGGVMVVVFGTRNATRDLDVVILSPADRGHVRELAATVADEKHWPSDWLNDAAKGFLIGPADGPIIFQSPGIVVRRPSIEQLLAMKLCAWRDDVDIADARRLLQELSGSQQEIWERVKAFLQPGKELKATYAFDDLCEERQ